MRIGCFCFGISMAKLGVVMLLAHASYAQPSVSLPNVIVLLVDDLGYADVGIHGATEVSTPNIDSLAKNGVRCTNGYVSGPYCSPTRAGLLTGRYQQRYGHEFNPLRHNQGGRGQGLPNDEKTIADRLKAVGYQTAIIGKWHLTPTSESFRQLFDSIRLSRKSARNLGQFSVDETVWALPGE